MIHRSLRSPVAIAAAATVFLAACGGDDGDGAASTEDFCDVLAAADAVDDDDTEASLAAFNDLVDAAPSEIEDELTTVRDAFARASELDVENDPDAFGEFFEIFLAPDVTAAIEQLEAYDIENCGGIVSDTDDDSDDSITFELDDEAGAEIDDPLYDPFFDDPVDPNEPSIDGLKLYLDTEFPTARWRPELGSFGFGQSGDSLTLDVGGANIEVDALEICAAVVAYGEQFVSSPEVEISTYVPNAGGGVGDEIPVARGSGGACESIG